MNMEIDVKFINLVRENKVLYDKRSGSYKRTDIKNKVWHKIAVEMNFKTDDEAIKKWRALRDKFVKERRKMKNVPSGAGSEVETWSLYPYLEFLDDFVQQRKQYSNLSVSQNGHEESQSQNVSQDVDYRSRSTISRSRSESPN
ncbi:transcription factor Adf-1-like [Photinus pyralis]|uniref:transcription factor Adf-1-like n=1 Tax=Photinus pyralis TaxID=7054 RepID=UPI0012670B87|nr:transcription factor Adf-1-like [Photinus pyralis]XP_031359377.1 transcription factor Adf-1-like [Photinus pyralis]